jgi:hypothetical protein
LRDKHTCVFLETTGAAIVLLSNILLAIMSAEDPWSWTVNDLVAELCRTQILLKATGCRAEQFPDAATLEDQLRDQEVTGSTFLTALDSNTLRTELGVQNLGQRLALLAVIDLLRGRSVAYKQHAATAGVQALNLEMQPVATDTPSATTTDANGRKRQKITHLTSVPPPSGKQNHRPNSATLATEAMVQPSVNGAGGWDYLLHWEQADQQEIDVQDLTTDEDHEDEDSNDIDDGAEEDPSEIPDQVEDPEPVKGRSKLSVAQIVNVINERIEYYSNSWTVNKGDFKGEEIDYDPEEMWLEAEASGRRQIMIKKYKADVAYYKARLDRYCKEIEDFAANNVDQVRKQCGVLEVTINSMMLSEWLQGIYELEIEDESEEDQLSSESPIFEPEHLDSRPDQVLPTQQSRPPPEIIDLGSPPASSQEDFDGMIIDSSPPPTAHVGDESSTSPDRFHTPDSVIADTVELPTGALFPPVSLPATRVVPPRPVQQHGDEAQNASFASARRWRWADLVDKQDSKRCVSKALQEMKREDIETIRDRLRNVGKADMIRQIPACLRMMARSETKMQGVLARDMPRIVTFTRLFLCWWLCDNYFRVEPSKWHLEELEKCLDNGSPDPSTFCDYLNTVMTTTFSREALRHPEQPSQAEIIDISSDDDEPAPKPATQRKSQKQRPQVSQHPVIIDLD